LTCVANPYIATRFIGFIDVAVISNNAKSEARITLRGRNKAVFSRYVERAR
jgi:hypothetical protein